MAYQSSELHIKNLRNLSNFTVVYSDFNCTFDAYSIDTYPIAAGIGMSLVSTEAYSEM